MIVDCHVHVLAATAALCLPTRSYAFPRLLEDEAVRKKIVHGSDWPIPSFPPLRAGPIRALKLLVTEGNWMRRAVLAKRAVGFDNDYFRRAAALLRMPADAP